ncbi:carbonic anhydrase [Neobacillus kokaensis]|uniref:Carbonic anhydrase-like protein YbcF n=1 Tax=Neobacillus kokaensis TaxID=2759023 RepID=A0ABQ3NAD2_9BACI|nr:carbonic anhydrase [Neobacillus kokaensis]GHI00196.1 putative carbonic anhydrase-like protein YbcF [Neobacillus kokaensis]
MSKNEKKKVLFVSGMGHKKEELIKQIGEQNNENIIIIESYGSVIAPFGEIMRNIIIAAYQENVDEIFVAAIKSHQNDVDETLKKVSENKTLQDKIQTLDYLFKNCMPEFPENNIKAWIGGVKDLSKGGQTSIDIIRNHPLMPSHVKVTELLINEENNVLC